MGLATSRDDQQDNHPLKRMRSWLSVDCNNSSCIQPWSPSSAPMACNSGNSGKQQLPASNTLSQPFWHTLPYVAVVEVYRHLGAWDKYNMALTCKDWLQPFTRPAHWRRGHFRFDGVNDWRALCFASMMGRALRHMTIDCAASSANTRAHESAVHLAYFISNLVNTNNGQLLSLQLRNLRRLAHCLARLEHNVITLLASLLEQQIRLQKLDLENGGLSWEDGAKVLASAGTGSGSWILSLNIIDLFMTTGNHDIGTDPRFIQALSTFTNLSELSVNHSYLSDDVLYLLSDTIASKLRLLDVSAHYFGRAPSRTSEETWAHLCYCCPSLRASFFLKGVGDYLALSNILTPGIPLSRLRWTSGIHSTAVNAQLCFDHIANNFREHLQSLLLDVYHTFMENITDVASVVERCPSLESLSITSSDLPVSKELRLELSIRRALATRLGPTSSLSNPAKKIQVVCINGRNVDLEQKWRIPSVGIWLVENFEGLVEHWVSR